MELYFIQIRTCFWFVISREIEKGKRLGEKKGGEGRGRT